MKMKQVIREKYYYGLGHIEFEFYVAGRTASWKCQLEVVWAINSIWELSAWKWWLESWEWINSKCVERKLFRAIPRGIYARISGRRRNSQRGSHSQRGRVEKSGIEISCFFSVTKSCPILCDPMDCSTPGFLVLHRLPEFTQTHVHWISDAIQPSHPLSPLLVQIFYNYGNLGNFATSYLTSFP